jgi:hypothetical protein
VAYVYTDQPYIRYMDIDGENGLFPEMSDITVEQAAQAIAHNVARPNNLIELYMGWDSDKRIPDIGFVFHGGQYEGAGLGPLPEEIYSWMWPAIKLFQDHDGSDWARIFREAMELMKDAPQEYQGTGEEVQKIQADREAGKTSTTQEILDIMAKGREIFQRLNPEARNWVPPSNANQIQVQVVAHEHIQGDGAKE